MDRLEELKSIGRESNDHASKIVQLRDDNGFNYERGMVGFENNSGGKFGRIWQLVDYRDENGEE